MLGTAWYPLGCQPMTSEVVVYWLVQRESDVPAVDDWLTDRERRALAGMRFEKRRSDWRLGRWTAKLALSACLFDSLDFSRLRDIDIGAAADGAPEATTDAASPPLAFSLSHSRGVGFCAVSLEQVPLGCDLEFVEPRTTSFLADYFTAEEQELIEGSLVAESSVKATLVWSAKESALKALRQGLRRDTRSVTVEFDSGGTAESWSPLSVTCRESSRSFAGWWCHRGEHVQTVVAERPMRQPIALLDVF